MRWVLSMILIAGCIFAEESIPSAKQASQCLDRLKEISTILTAAEQAALDTNDHVRADCIHGHMLSIKGLIEISRTAQTWLEASLENQEMDAAQVELEKIQTACLRGEKLYETATNCVASLPSPPKKKPVTNTPTAKKSATPESQPWRQPRRAAVRTEKNCLRQSDLACLFVRSMNLDPTRGCVTILQERQVAPRTGWEPERCATVDDICEMAVQVLNLKVENPDDPASSWKALREFGLPVDTILPAYTPGTSSPILLDSEAREFLTEGLAVPTLTSRPYTPR